MTSYIAPDMFAENCPAWPFGDLQPQSFDFIMADPPWRFVNYSDKGETKGPEPHYATMTDAEIIALPVRDLARASAALWLWATWPKIALAVEVAQAWGFQVKTGGAWNKKRWGTGYVMRSVCEPFLIATVGEPKINGASVPNLIEESRREHSRKPEIAYELAETMMPDARRADVFSRETRPGWTSWGNESGKFDGGNAA